MDLMNVSQHGTQLSKADKTWIALCGLHRLNFVHLFSHILFFFCLDGR